MGNELSEKVGSSGFSMHQLHKVAVWKHLVWWNKKNKKTFQTFFNEVKIWWPIIFDLLALYELQTWNYTGNQNKKWYQGFNEVLCNIGFQKDLALPREKCKWQNKNTFMLSNGTYLDQQRIGCQIFKFWTTDPSCITLQMFCLLNSQMNACEPNPNTTVSDFNS
mgnify:CR=1 FL=1